MAPRISQITATAIIEIAESLIDSAETQLHELKRLGHNTHDSLLFGQYQYWKNYRSAMRDLIRITRARMNGNHGNL